MIVFEGILYGDVWGDVTPMTYFNPMKKQYCCMLFSHWSLVTWGDGRSS